MGDQNRRSYREDNSSPDHVDHTCDLRQVDGSADYRSQVSGGKGTSAPLALPRPFPQRLYEHQALPRTAMQTTAQQKNQGPQNAVTDVLPYCTTEPPLDQEQVIALSDVAGSLSELALLALSASAGDRVNMERLTAAVGSSTAANIVDFFAGEWEVEG